MNNKIPIVNMTKEEWLRERRKSIGGSDAGAILGLNPYRTPYAVWAEKTGRLPEQEDNEAMRQGRDLEAYVAQRFSEKSGKRVERYNYLLRSSDSPYLHANIDRRVIGERSGLECKTASALNMRTYRGGNFPESYYAQCVSYLAVTGWERWYLATLVLNKAFYIYQITTMENDPLPEWCESSVYVSPEELSALRRAAAHFWEQYVLPDIPPPVDGLKPTEDAMQKAFPHDDGGCVELLGRESIFEEYFSLARQQSTIQQQMDAIKQVIQGDMKENSSAFCSIALVSWKSQERQTFDFKAFQRKNPEIDTAPFLKTTQRRAFRITKKEEN